LFPEKNADDADNADSKYTIVKIRANLRYPRHLRSFELNKISNKTVL